MGKSNKINSIRELRILLGISGGISAYKSIELIRELKKAGHLVRAVCTKSALQFVTKTTVQAISGHPMHDDLWDATTDDAMRHIELARWANLVLIAPATADCMARLAHGLADDLLMNICLATTAPIMLAPGMNEKMWHNLATQDNVKKLMARGITVLPVDEGEQACGDYGLGRMLEPEAIYQAVDLFLHNHQPFLKNKKILITAGPTQEAIDPVRCITNKSSGKMGYALAEVASTAGGEVILVSGPVALPVPANVKCIRVENAEAMLQAVQENLNNIDIFISVAAVADYRVAKASSKKLHKQDQFNLTLIKNIDILHTIATQKNKPFCVGFAAQTHEIKNYAQQKLKDKNLDMIIVNDVSQTEIGFGSDENECTVLWSNHERFFKREMKSQIAYKILQLIAEVYSGYQSEK